MVLSIALPPCEKMRECSFNPNNGETWCPFHCCFFDLFKRCYPKIVKGTESQYDKLILREKGQWADYFLSEHSTSGRNSGNYLWKCHESGKCLKFLCKCRRVIPLHLVKEKKNSYLVTSTDENQKEVTLGRDWGHPSFYSDLPDKVQSIPRLTEENIA